jgi:hypothetical protein
MSRPYAGRRVVVLALAAATLTFGACGESSTTTTTTGGENGSSGSATQSNDAGNSRASKLAEGHCSYSASEEQTACENSYAACLETPKAEVKKYQGGFDDPTFVNLATSHANREYGDRGPTWDAGFAGCTAALLDEYTRLQR